MIEKRLPVSGTLQGRVIEVNTRLQQLIIQDKAGSQHALCFSTLEDFPNNLKEEIKDTSHTYKLQGRLLEVVNGKFKPL